MNKISENDVPTAFYAEEIDVGNSDETGEDSDDPEGFTNSVLIAIENGKSCYTERHYIPILSNKKRLVKDLRKFMDQKEKEYDELVLEHDDGKVPTGCFFETEIFGSL